MFRSGTDHNFSSSGDKKQKAINIPFSVLCLGMTLVVVFLALKLLPSYYVRLIFLTGAINPALYYQGLYDNISYWLAPFLYGFIHYDTGHLIINLFMLVAFLSPLASRTTFVGLWLFFILSSVAGAILFVLSRKFLYGGEGISIMIGASAGVSGALGALVGLSLLKGDHFPPPAPFNSKKTATSFALLWLGLNLLFVILPAEVFGGAGAVAWESHVGGFIAGMFIFKYFDKLRMGKMYKEKNQEPEQ